MGKKNLLLLGVVCFVSFFTSCSSDDGNVESIEGFKVDHDLLNYEANGGKKEVKVTSKLEWKAELDEATASWLSIERLVDKIVVEAKVNETTEERVGIINLLFNETGKSLVKINVKQLAADNNVGNKAYQLAMPTKDMFKGSNIYKVLDDSGNEVARLYLEYLKSTEIAEQRITLHTLKDGKINNTEGVVLPDGGAIKWDLKLNKFTYSKGTNADAKTVFIQNDGSVTFSKGEGLTVVDAKLEAYVLEDKRNEEVSKYALVKIGGQIWLAENLKTKYYLDGSPINSYKNKQDWYETTEGAYVFYDNDIANKDVMGGLYNWMAATSPKGLAPKGFRVTGHKDWATIAYYLDPANFDIDDIYGGSRESETIAPIMKSTSGWLFDSGNNKPGDGNNLSGLNIYACGSTSESKFMDFSGKGRQAYFWTTDEYEEKTAMFRRFYYDEVFVNQWFENMNYGYSIRCVIDLDKF